MARRLRVRKARRRRDEMMSFKRDGAPRPHKISYARSKRALAKKAYPQT